MSKINPLISSSSKFDDERLAGGYGKLAAKQSNTASLKRAVMANLLWEDIAYMDGQSVADEIKRLIPLVSAEDVYNIALEARVNQKLRHTPLFIASEMAKYKEHNLLLQDLLPLIITRADMLTDFLAIYWKKSKQPLTHQIKKGLAKAFYNFKEYHFAKYDRNAPIKLRDVMFLVHPKPRNQDEEILYNKIANRTLTPPDTWEVALSTGKDKKETWERLIKQDKLGGLAMLRNINNMKKAGVESSVIKKGLTSLKSSMLLPLDFLKAARINPEFERSIEKAMLKAYSNLQKLPGKTLFIVDVSGSMGFKNSSCSKFNRLDYAMAMTMLAANQCENFDLVCTAGRDDTFTHSSIHIKYPNEGFGIFDDIVGSRDEVGFGGIFTRQCLEWCKKNVGNDYDRIIIFSDSQDCDLHDERTPKPFGKRNYICDISAHTKGINYKGVWDAEISGFSEHFLTFIAAYEGLNNQFEEINYPPTQSDE